MEENKRKSNVFESLISMSRGKQQHYKSFYTTTDMPPNLIDGILASESDWEFILKIHGLVETLIRDTIVNHIDFAVAGVNVADEELYEIIRHLNTNQLIRRFGKHLPIIHKRKKFLFKLIQIRGHYAHGIKNIQKPIMNLVRDEMDDYSQVFDCLLEGQEPLTEEEIFYGCKKESNSKHLTQSEYGNSSIEVFSRFL